MANPEQHKLDSASAKFHTAYDAEAEAHKVLPLGTDGSGYFAFPLTAGGAAIKVDATFSGTVTGTFTTDAEHDEDTPHVSGDTGMLGLGIRRDSAAELADTEGDYIGQARSRFGEQYVAVFDPLPVSDGGGAITVDGTVAISGTVPVSLSEPISVDDNGGSLTVDGTVTANAGTGTFAVGDGGGSLTVDGTVAISGTVPVSLSEPISVDDNGGSLTVDGTVAISGTVPVSGTVAVSSVGGTVAVSAAALPLPSGAATETTLAALNAKVTTVNTGAVVLAAGTANIGDVDVLTLPALPAGTNNIGDVDVLSLPALPAGTNNIGDVDVLTVPAPLNVVGGGAEATALRVTLANNSTGTLAVNQGTAGPSSWLVTINGAVATGATSLGKAEDAQHASGDSGVFALAVRNDSASASLTSLDGDYSGIAVDVKGRVYTDGSTVTQPVSGNLGITGSVAVTNAGTFAVQDSQKLADNAGFTDGTTPLMPIGMIFDETAGTALTENDIAAPRINANRAAVTTIEDSTTRGRRATVIAGGGLVTAGFDTDGAAFTQESNRVTAVGYILDENAGTALAENDVAAARIDSKRAQIHVLEDATTRGQRLAISAAGAASVVLTASALNIGDVDVLTVPAPLNIVGPGQEALALRVTLANDSTGIIGINGVFPGSGATSLGKLEDSSHSSGDTGVFMLGVRNDNGATAFAGVNGEYSGVAVDDGGRVHVVVHQSIAAATNSFTAGSQDGTVVDVSRRPMANFSLQVSGVGGTPTVWTIALQGSLDGVTYTTIFSHSSGAGNTLGQTVPALGLAPYNFLKTRSGAITLSGATAVSATFLGV